MAPSLPELPLADLGEKERGSERTHTPTVPPLTEDGSFSGFRILDYDYLLLSKLSLWSKIQAFSMVDRRRKLELV